MIFNFYVNKRGLFKGKCTPECKQDSHCTAEEYCNEGGNCVKGCIESDVCGSCGQCVDHVCQEPECCLDSDCQVHYNILYTKNNNLIDH